MADVTLTQYQTAERVLVNEEHRRGVVIHGFVAAVVTVVLVGVNLTVADEFPWSGIAAVGIGLGVWLHWDFGVRRAEDLMRRHQADVERRAGRL